MVILVGYCENGGLIWDFKCFQFDFCLAHCSTQKITVAICLLHCHENVMAVYRCTPNSTSTFMSVEIWSLREVCHSHETFVNGATHPVFMVVTQDKSHGPSYQAHCICTLYHVFNSVFRWPHTGHAKPLLIRSISSEHTDTTQFWVFTDITIKYVKVDWEKLVVQLTSVEFSINPQFSRGHPKEQPHSLAHFSVALTTPWMR